MNEESKEKQSCKSFIHACSQTLPSNNLVADDDETRVEHALNYEKYSDDANCNVCGSSHQNRCFQCKDCELWVHEDCKKWSKTSSCSSHLDHFLSLLYLPQEYRQIKLSCDVCHEELQHVHWVYSCRPCRFFLHLHCSAAHKDMIIEEVCSMFNMVKLPVANAAVKLTSRFLKQNGLITIQKTEQISNFHNNEHSLLLTSSDNTKDELVCDGCIGPIVDEYYYSCKQCSYFLHVPCSRLPKGLELLKHPGHLGHPLHLNQPEYCFSMAKCNQCLSETNGWYFECRFCNEFRLDMKCTFLPNDISHRAHMHPLARISDSHIDCSACGESPSGSSSYGCKNCNFYIGIDCALLPPKITHKWDKHALLLMYPPFLDNPDDFLCEICEKTVHPKHWIYHCKQCDQSFHPRCISRLSENRNIKFGGNIKIAGHFLELVEKGKYKSRCGSCEKHLDKENALKCTECDLHVCRKCALNNLGNKKFGDVAALSPCNGIGDF